MNAIIQDISHLHVTDQLLLLVLATTVITWMLTKSAQAVEVSLARITNSAKVRRDIEQKMSQGGRDE